MTQEHPIIPPDYLVKEWSSMYWQQGSQATFTDAARWGADQELEACINWLYENGWGQAVDGLRAARRPKPPSLKKQALGALESLNGDCVLEGFECPEKVALIRRALESLPD